MEEIIIEEFSKEIIEELDKNKKLYELQLELASTDYQAIKYAEGYFTEEEYEPIRQKRETLRQQIRELID